MPEGQLVTRRGLLPRSHGGTRPEGASSGPSPVCTLGPSSTYDVTARTVPRKGALVSRIGVAGRTTSAASVLATEGRLRPTASPDTTRMAVARVGGLGRRAASSLDPGLVTAASATFKAIV